VVESLKAWQVDTVPIVALCDDVNMSETHTLKAPAKRMLDRGHKPLETVLRKTNSAGIGLLQSAANEVSFLMEAVQLAISFRHIF
jgi:hypothetical protein